MWESRSSPGFSSKSLLDQSIGKALSFCGGGRQTGGIMGGRRGAANPKPPSFPRRRESKPWGVVRGGYGEILHFVQNDASDGSAQKGVILSVAKNLLRQTQAGRSVGTCQVWGCSPVRCGWNPACAGMTFVSSVLCTSQRGWRRMLSIESSRMLFAAVMASVRFLKNIHRTFYAVIPAQAGIQTGGRGPRRVRRDSSLRSE